MLLQDKVAIVTGAAQGIGLACAQRLIREGAKVILADVNDTAGQSAAADLNSNDNQAMYVSCDVSERLDVHNLMAACIETHGRVDVLVNNAGILDDAPFLELEEAEFERIIRTNLKGSFLVGQAVAKQMVKQAEGRGPNGAIVNMSSINSFFALPDHVAYTVSKGGIAQLTKAMALALAPHKIRVNAVGPGTIATPMIDAVVKDEAFRQKVLSRTPLGRYGRSEEIAAVVVWLLSEEASYVTGETIIADGGRMSLNYMVDVPDGR